MVVLCRLLMVTAVSLDRPVERVSISINHEAVIAAVLQKGPYIGQDKVYWTNRTSEIKGILEELKIQASDVEEVTHMSSKLNPADIGTRGEAKIDRIRRGSPWQTAPKFLTTRREYWPVRHPNMIQTAGWHLVK